MLKNIIKKSISEKQLEKIFRAKQYIKDSKFLDKNFEILPKINHRIKNEVIPLNPFSEISVRGWRNLITLYEHSNVEQQDDFRRSVKVLIISSGLSFRVFQTKYINNIFLKHNNMYLEFLGTAYYANGNIEKAMETFSKLFDIEPSDRVYLYMSRCLMQIDKVKVVVDFLLHGCGRFPNSTILLLSLSNAYFRLGNTILANQTLDRINRKDIAEIRQKAHNLEELSKEIKESLEGKAIVRPIEKLGFQAYTEVGVKYYWETLFLNFVGKTRFQHGWSDLCYITENKIEYYLKKYSDIKTVLNFGVFCAVPDFNLAVKHPGISFIGVDRENTTKELNDSAFVSDNISFHALDMLDIIYEDKTEVTEFVKYLIAQKSELMIFHARTATLIYPEALKRFYKSCAQLKVKYIAVYENMCLSRSELKYYDFDDLPSDTIPYFSVMMIHNYKKYLEEAGYEIIEREVWNYSELLWEGKDLYGAESWYCLGDGHVCLLARLK